MRRFVSLLALVSALAIAQPSPPLDRKFGGCSGHICAGPSASITLASVNLRTGAVSAGLSTGIGYGLTLFSDRWYVTGLSGNVLLNVGEGGGSQLFPSVILSFAEYVRIGWGWRRDRSPDGTTTTANIILFGLGLEFGAPTS